MTEETYEWVTDGRQFRATLTVPPFTDEPRAWRIVYTPEHSAEHIEHVMIPAGGDAAAVLNTWAEREVIPRSS